MTNEANKNVGYLKIPNKDQRITVASILFEHGYTVSMARTKKNGKTYEYYVKYEIAQMDDSRREAKDES